MHKSFAVLLFLCLAAPVFAQEEPTGADLLAEKSGPAAAPAGSNVSYAIRVANLGPEAAVAVKLDDVLPGDMTFVSATQDTGPSFNCTTPNLGDPGAVSCTLASLAVGEEATFTFVFQIPPTAPQGTQYTNFATATSQTPDNNEENNTGVAATIIPISNADLGIRKTGPTAAGEDTDVTFTISLTNSGPDAATTVTVTDTLPGDMTFVSLANSPSLSCTTPAVGAGGTITCTAASLAAGATATILLTGHIPAETESGTQYSNTVVVTSDVDPAEENDIATHTVTVSAIDVSVVKTGPASVIAGDNIPYTITVTNSGPDAAPVVLLSDAIPAGTTVESFSQTSGPFANCATAPPNIVCETALGAGQSVVFSLELDAGANTSVTNTATVTADGFDTDASNQSSTVNTTVSPRADLAIVKTGPATVTAGNDVTYNVTVTNNGPSAATNVIVSDPAPPNTTFVSTTAATVPTLAPGASVIFTYTFHVAPSATGTITNTATVSSSVTDPDNGDNSSTVNSAVTTSADVSVTKTGPAAAPSGTNVTYTVVVANAGPSDAASVVMNDVLPAGTTFVSLTQSGAAFNCVTGATVTCTAATLAASASATFDITVAIAAGATGTIDNTATVSSTTPDPNGANNTSTAIIGLNPGATDLSIVKTVNGANFPRGGLATFTIVATNNGPAVAFGTTVTDPLPAGATLESFAASQGTCTGTTTVTCTVGILAVGASATITLNVRLPHQPGNLQNTATVSAANAETAAGNNASTAALAVTNEIPTLSEWALIALAAALALVALRARLA